MKYLRYILLLGFAIYCRAAGYSQELSAGVFSGINFSDIHSNSLSGKWKSKPGPVEGLLIDYSFNNVLGIRSGLNYSAVYYEHIPYNRSLPYEYSFSSSSYYPAPGMIYYPVNLLMDYSFLTIPIQVMVSIPSKPELNLSAGMFYSFVQDKSLYSGFYYERPDKNDWGFYYSAGLSYPLGSVIKGSLNASYMTGRQEFGPNSNFRHGSVEYTVGIAVTNFLKKSNSRNQHNLPDSINQKIYLTYRGGINLTWNSCEYYDEKYSLSTGPSIGFAVNFRWTPKSSFQTGLSFERKGFSMKDSSSVFYRYSTHSGSLNETDTKIGIDYIVIPALINFYIGKSERFFINTGPYFGFRLNARVTGEAYYIEKGENVYNVVKTVVYDDIEGATDDTDYGWIFGGGVTVPLSGKLMLDAGLQYQRGLKDIFNSSAFPEVAANETKESIIRNGSLSFQIGLRIPVLK